jgi:hypothetical protein
MPAAMRQSLALLASFSFRRRSTYSRRWSRLSRVSSDMVILLDFEMEVLYPGKHHFAALDSVDLFGIEPASCGSAGNRGGASPVPGQLHFLSFSAFGGGTASNLIMAFASW